MKISHFGRSCGRGQGRWEVVEGGVFQVSEGGILGRSRPSIPWASCPWNQQHLIAKICHSLDPRQSHPGLILSPSQSEGPLLYHPWQQLEQSIELHLQRALCHWSPQPYPREPEPSDPVALAPTFLCGRLPFDTWDWKPTFRLWEWHLPAWVSGTPHP